MKNHSVMFRCKLLQSLFIIVIILILHQSSLYADVRVTEDSLSIATYLVDAPNVMPRFYEGNTHQGVQRRIYPYPMNDNLTFDKEDRSYHIVRFENEYIDLGIMPDLGGRIFYAEDKTNGYNWFYRQHVIKPSLIGMVGYWISGANAWGFPHHHGPNTVKPMDYKIVSNMDGSETIWIANTDQRHRMRIVVGYTIFPKSSLVEMTIRPVNITPIVNSFLFWANPSVHVDTNYQVIFPPSIQYVTQHAKWEMASWPIAKGRYNGFDYTDVDISLWKNIGVPSSFFSWDPQEDYFGGYDHGKEAGTVWLGNHHTCPGMKFWAWGNNPGGDRANASLTDTDGHYIELMAGAYTDNQPDYSWIQPYEGKNVTMIWFPIRKLGGLKYANRNGALNLEISSENTAMMRLNTTSPHAEAKVILKTGEKVLFEKIISIDPATPFADSVALSHNISEYDLELQLFDKNNEVLLSYQPRSVDNPMPETMQRPPSPEEMKSVEELYLTGLRLNQFYNASWDPMPYYMEALKRDPENYRVNTQLGILAIKDKNWDEAETRLRTAVQRITMNYTRARDGEAQYYLGVALKAKGKLKEAYDHFYDATWSAAWHSPAYYQLAELDCIHKAFDKALDHVNRSLTTNTNNARAINLKTAILRKQGQFDDAMVEVCALLKKDPLNHQAKNEMALILQEMGEETNFNKELKNLSDIMRDEVQSYLELATQYGNAGFYKEAVDILHRLELKEETLPMLYYYSGYYWQQLGNEDKTLFYYQSASQKPHTYCFPFRWESEIVLRHAMSMNPDDAKAPYYLGNLLYEHQPEKAIQAWEASRDKDDTFYIVHRNLAVAYEEVQQDIPRAMKSMEKAVAANSDDPRLLFEMDQLYDQNKASSQTKYDLLKTNSVTVHRRSESLLRLATRSIEVGKYDDALEILLNNEFPQFEGGREKQDTYLNAFTLRGLNYLKAGEFDLALKDFETAFEYPIGRFGRSRWAQFHYLMGAVYEKQGETDKAKESFQHCLDIDVSTHGRDQEFLYYRGLALQKMDQAKAAKKLFNDLLKRAQSGSESNFFRQFEGGGSEDKRHAMNQYLSGLAYKGLGKKGKAKKAFSEALEFDPSLVWSQYYLSLISD